MATSYNKSIEPAKLLQEKVDTEETLTVNIWYNIAGLNCYTLDMFVDNSRVLRAAKYLETATVHLTGLCLVLR